ncbi:hypothetical protein HGRIS_008204 [Hohenbuehelia grisea]|uniref:NADH:flavin oxidoreductase/NADH oxidase N-terminal domain-containing protein n=1 Tax=Hohenbuehelia grisea TaxID=104357 RepID=A0ABR3J7B3_9AGAR
MIFIHGSRRLSWDLPSIFGFANRKRILARLFDMTSTNKPVPGAREYYPLNEPAIGTPLGSQNDDNVPFLFRPLTLRGTTFKNRIFVSPMCQYSSDNGHATDWHLVHLGGFATRGAAAICVEATSVVPEGRISPQDSGLWTDTQIEPLKRIVDFCHAQGAKVGLQLSHAGRKSSTTAPWITTQSGQRGTAQIEDGGWPDEVYAPSDIPFNTDHPFPKEMSEEHLQYVEDAFVAAVERCKQIGFDFIELHGAHGYLLHSFVSPLSNVRSDQYGGQALENRLRFPLRVIQQCRKAWSKPLFVRISATDWAEGPEQAEDGTWKQWGLDQSKVFVGEMQKLGVDLIDCSTGGNWAKQKIPYGLGYQVPFAEAIKKAYPTMVVTSVGMIVDPHQAESYISSGKADAVFLARELIRTPHWPLAAAQALGVKVKAANQYERGWIPVPKWNPDLESHATTT